MAKKQIVTEALIDFCARVEQEAYPLTVCKVTHPDAIEGDVYEGTFAGFRLSKGATPSALISDGSTIGAPKADAAE